MNDLTFELLKIVIAGIMILVTRYLVPWLKMKLKNEVDEVTWVQVMRIVRAIEQTLCNVTGADKKARAAIVLREWAQKNHITITDTQIDDLIEAAVFVMNSEKDKKNG